MVRSRVGSSSRPRPPPRPPSPPEGRTGPVGGRTDAHQHREPHARGQITVPARRRSRPVEHVDLSRCSAERSPHHLSGQVGRASCRGAARRLGRLAQAAEQAAEARGAREERFQLHRGTAPRAAKLDLDPGLRQRALFYWARLYTSQIGKGDGYVDLAPTLSMFILDFVELETTRYHSHFRLL
jgi:hypothetical protein